MLGECAHGGGEERVEDWRGVSTERKKNANAVRLARLRAKKLTKERRVEIAKQGAEARWGKRT